MTGKTAVVTMSMKIDAETITEQITQNAGQANLIDEVIPQAATHLQLELAFEVAKLKSFLAISDVDLTIKTNSSSAPQETLTVGPDNPIFWCSDTGPAAPFAGDVTKIFVTEANASDARLQIKALVDPT